MPRSPTSHGHGEDGATMSNKQPGHRKSVSSLAGNVAGNGATAAFSIWLPGVGYVTDSGDAATAEQGQPGAGPHQIESADADLVSTSVSSSWSARTHSHTKSSSVDSRVSPGVLVQLKPGSRKQRRRDKQRHNRKQKNANGLSSSETASTCQDFLDDSSCASSSPSLSSSASHASTAIHTRTSSTSGLHFEASSKPSLAPPMLAKLLSMAAWVCLIRRVQTICVVRLIVEEHGSRREHKTVMCNNLWESMLKVFGPSSHRRQLDLTVMTASAEKYVDACVADTESHPEHTGLLHELARQRCSDEAEVFAQRGCVSASNKHGCPMEEQAGEGNIFSRPSTPPHARAPKTPTGATAAYIVGQKAAQRENEADAAARIQSVCRGYLERRKTKAAFEREASASRLCGLVRGRQGRQEARSRSHSFWKHDEEVILATMRWMAEKEQIFKVLFTQLDIQADFLFPDRKRRYAGSLRPCVMACAEKKLVVVGGRSPKEWVSVHPDISIDALPVAPEPTANIAT